MSSIENLLINQQEIIAGIEQQYVNFKKDSEERKTSDYIRRRVDTLDGYWNEFHSNHQKLLDFENQTDHYFTSNIYEQTKKRYEEIKGIFLNFQPKGKGLKLPPFIPASLVSSPTPNRSDKQQERPKTPIMESRATNSKTEDMYKRQSSNFKAFQRTIQNIDLHLVTEKWEFEDLLHTLQARWSAIDSLHWELDSEVNGSDRFYEQNFTAYEKQYHEMKRAINSKLWSVCHREKSTPQLEIPEFSGNFHQWVSFKDLFMEAIGNNPSLSSAQKMQFLKAKTKGEAERVIQHLPISSENYSTCWKLLNHRFDNKSLIFSSHMDILLGLPNIQQQSLGPIKKLHDVTLESLNAIKNLGVDIATWDPILVHILSQKLDSDTNDEYIKSLQNRRELPILQDFLDFLEGKIMALEKSRRKQNSGAQKSVQHNLQNHFQPNFKKQYPKAFNNFQHENFSKSFHVSELKCPICNRGHGIFNCNTFKEMHNNQKLKIVQKLKLCLNCLFNHGGTQCISSKRCRICTGKHNTLLHDACSKLPSAPVAKFPPVSDLATTSGANRYKTDLNVNKTAHVSSQSDDSINEILLATAEVKVTSNDGTEHVMRALVDQGSQISLITEKAAQILGIKRQKCKGVIFGVGQKENSCKGMLNITCKSMYSDFSFKAEVLIMQNLIKNLPNKSFPKPAWSFIENINLADPEFYSSKPVDLLLGADIYSLIAMGGILRGEDLSQPIAQQTHLGWLLCGSVKTFHCNVILNNLEDLHKFWEIEEISEEASLSVEDQHCMEYNSETTRRLEDGCYEVRLPLKENFEQELGLSKQMAIAQFKNLERKFERQEHFAKEYRKFMREYQELNHMVPAVCNTKPECYLPHHGVERAESTTTKLITEWSKIGSDLENIKTFKIPRWIGYHDQHNIIELHGFCDASEKAYAAVIYARIHNQSTYDVTVQLLASKTKLVPSKKAVSLPRLELSGADLLSKLMSKIIKCLDEHKIEIFGWSDSMVALSWIQGNPSRWKTFVANRVTNITKTMPKECWRYVNTQENPADAASRGMSASQLKGHALWWQGPAWLQAFNKGKKQQTFTTEMEVKSKQANLVQKETKNSIVSELLEKYSSFTKITRVLAWILRSFAPKCNPKPSYLTLRELKQAKNVVIKHVQSIEFEVDIEQINKHGTVNSKSKLLNLNPFTEQDGILRVGGRLNNANLDPEMKHPKIIPRDSKLTELLIDQAHLLTFHGGPRVTLANLRKQYWIIGGNNVTKKQIRKCVTCRKYDTSKNHQLMGDLPEARCNSASPFYHTGVDYTGFLQIKSNRGRGSKTSKGYVAIFVCMVTKAVHLELVSDLTSSAFIAALRRMAARRGSPRHLHSDNGTNFVGADKTLQEEYLEIARTFDENLLVDVTDMNIEWHFNSPSWPSAGGLWERAVRSLKHHLKRVVGDQKLTFEEYSTVLAQIEGCMNSRPLCALSEDVDDLDFLTPSHFLTGRPGTSIIETENDARTRWYLTRKIFEDLWKRWKSEYLCQLNTRSKWMRSRPNLQMGDLVVIHEDNIPAGKWAMGRVVDLHPGKDGLIRVVTLKTKNGYLKRPIIKLSVLPINNSKQENNECERESKLAENNESKRDSKSAKMNENKDRESSNDRSLRPRKPKLSSIAMAIIFFMTIVGQVHGSYNISQFSSNQSLYFDPLAKMQLIRDKWTLVVYYDLAPYWEGTTALNKLSDYLDKACYNIHMSVHCNMILSQLRHEYKELQYYNQLLLTQHFSEHVTRRRRGLINGIGNIANSLFGVLDERFAEKYAQDIDLINKNQKHLALLWRNQTSVVESEFNLLKRTEELMTKQHKIINNQLNFLAKETGDLQNNMNKFSKMEDFTLSAITAISILENLKRVQDTLLNTITDVYRGQFNLHLLTPGQLRDELNIISGQLTSELTLPIDNFQADLRNIYQLLKVKARFTEKYFIFEVTFPLISRDSYKLYRLIPILHKIDNVMMRIIPSSDLAAINLKRDSYLSLTNQELSSCVNKEETYLCEIQKPIFHIKDDNNFCYFNRDKNQCRTEKLACQNTWISLAEPTMYFYFYCVMKAIRVICEEQVKVVELYKAGIIFLEQGCMIKDKDFTIHSRQIYQNSLEVKSNFYIPKIDQINDVIRVQVRPINSTYNQINQSDSKEITSAIESLNDQIKQMKESSFDQLNSISTHDIHHYSISYVLVAAVAALAAAGAWRWRAQRRCRRARISPDVELQSISASDSVVRASARNSKKADRIQPSGSARQQSKADREQPSVSDGAGNNNKASSPIFQKRFT